MCSAISYHVAPKSTHSLIKYTVLSYVLMSLKLQLASILQDFLSKRARGHLKLKVLVQHEPFKKNGKQTIYRLIRLKYKSLSRNLLHLRRDVTLFPTRIFSYRFCTSMQIFLCLSATREKQVVSRKTVPLSSSPVPPSSPSAPRWDRQGRMCCVRRTHLEVPLDASTGSARQSPHRSRAQSAAG